MTTILSARAISVLVEQQVRRHGTQPEHDVLSWLAEQMDVDTARAQRGVQLAIDRGRIHRNSAAVLASQPTRSAADE